MFKAKKLDDAGKLRQIQVNYEHSRRAFPGIGEITAEQLKQRRDAGDELVVVDVREPAEQEVSMIDGAITVQQFEQDPEAHRDKTIVAYCTIGHRSGLYTQKLQGAGFAALNLCGAILAWTHVDGAIVDADGPTKRVHVWSPKVNLIAEGYEAVW